MSDMRNDSGAMHPAATGLNVKGYEELALAELPQYPLLTQCHDAWLAAHRDQKLPAVIGPDALPAGVLPYTMLLDYLPEQRDVRVRLAGNYVGERTSGDLGGRRLANFFNPHDADIVFASMEQVAQLRRASLARRSYVSLEGNQLSYVRLILPLSLDGTIVTGFFKTIEPATLVNQPS
ncbi:MAG: PAS domain-containing protein [Ferrovibrio sp.]